MKWGYMMVSSEGAPRKRVAVVGLDGMYFDLLMRLVKHGLMPYLADEILKDSIRTEILSTDPPYTPPAWTTIASGVYPEKHGVFSFLIKKGFGARLVSTFFVKYPRIWEILAMNKMHSVVINLPIVYPFDYMVLSPKTIIIPGWDCPVKLTYPNSLMSDPYIRGLLNYSHEWWDVKKYSLDKEYVRILEGELSIKEKALNRILRKNFWSLFFVVFSEPDWIMHRFPWMHATKDLSLFSRVFGIIDRIISRISKKVDFLIICSDHGFKVYERVLNMNVLLYEVGALKVLNRMKYKSRLHIRKLLKRLRLSSLARSIILNNLLPNIMSSRLFGSFIRSKIFSRAPTQEIINLEKSDAYSPENFIIFTKNDAIRDNIASEISRYTKVYVPGKRLGSYIPDIIVSPRKNTTVKPATNLLLEGSKEVVSKKKIADHSYFGVFIAYGNINKTISRNVKNTDIVPTILAYLDLPVPHNLDGNALESVMGAPLRMKNYIMRWRILRRLKSRSR